MKFNIFKRIKQLEENLLVLHKALKDDESNIKDLKEKVGSLERINLYGRNDEPVVIVDEMYNMNRFLHIEPVLRLYIDGEEYTIRNVDDFMPSPFGGMTCKILNKSITVDGDIATVVIQTYPDCEDVYHIEYDKGTYVHQVRKIEKESED